jgi:hypothetical protein
MEQDQTMNVREFVGEEKITKNFVGEATAPEWDLPLDEAEQDLLGSATYLDEIEDGHRELKAYRTSRYGSSIYAPEDLPPFMEKFMKKSIPLTHVLAFYALRGNSRDGTY